MKPIFSIVIFSVLLTTCLGCSDASDQQGAEAEKQTITPVTIEGADTSAIVQGITLNATSTYLLKTDIKANINGYILRSSVVIGSRISKGQILFVLETKEARSLGNTINKLDSSFKFSGINSIKSPSDGFVSMLNHQPGDYVLDGETIAGITDKNSFGFVLDIPYEYNQLLHKNGPLQVILPDGTILKGYVSQVMPSLDSIAQTQRVWIKTPDAKNIPENLMAKVVLIQKQSSHISLPKGAVFADESQTHFWVMKLLNDSTAIKTTIQKGIENDSLVEIVSPLITKKDSFVVQGGYGLPDTARILIQK